MSFIPSERKGVVPTLEPIRGRFDEYRLHSMFTDEEALRPSETQIKRHEIRLTEVPQKQQRQTTMESLFPLYKIQEAEYRRDSPNGETVPFYLIRLYSEINMTYRKRKIMRKIFKDSDRLKQKQYEALIDYGLFHDEIMDCLAESQYDFEIAIYKLLVIKQNRIELVKILRATFEAAQIQDCMEECDEWFEVVYMLMSKNPSRHVSPLSQKELDPIIQEYMAQISQDGCFKLFTCLYEFGFTPQNIIAKFRSGNDWNVLPYKMLQSRLEIM
jgi:hypothetical protein